MLVDLGIFSSHTPAEPVRDMGGRQRTSLFMERTSQRSKVEKRMQKKKEKK